MLYFFFFCNENMLHLTTCIFLLSGKIVLVASFETCAEMLGSRSTVFVLNIHAEMHQWYSRIAVARDVQDGVGTLQDADKSYDMAEFRKVRKYEIFPAVVSEWQGTEI